MSIENPSGPDSTATGQATPVAPEGGGGQSASTEPQAPVTQSGQAQSTQTQAEESFYADFHSLPPEKQEELKPFYKQMQGAFTKKAQELARIRQESKQKTQAYDQFVSNPVENILRMAQQYGLQLSPAGGGQQAAQSERQSAVSPDWTPNTWDEVMQRTGEYISPQIQQMLDERDARHRQELADLRASIGEYRQEKVSKQLNEIDPEWHQYEDEMRAILEDHPTLAKNISALYRAAVPLEIIQARANQAALKKYEAKSQAAKMESSGHSRQSNPAKPTKMTFDEAFQAAKRELGRK